MTLRRRGLMLWMRRGSRPLLLLTLRCSLSLRRRRCMLRSSRMFYWRSMLLLHRMLDGRTLPLRRGLRVLLRNLPLGSGLLLRTLDGRRMLLLLRYGLFLTWCRRWPHRRDGLTGAGLSNRLGVPSGLVDTRLRSRLSRRLSRPGRLAVAGVIRGR